MKGIFAVLLLAAVIIGAIATPTPANLIVISRAQLCVTEGTIEETTANRLRVDVPKMRAFAAMPTAQDAEARFTYLGPTSQEKRLGSGESRRQFGLKLRAQDPCNLVYAMWRIEPEQKVVVSVKLNPGMHSSAECGNQGYTNIKPSRSSPVPLLRPGDSHTLRAAMHGSQITVWADGKAVWEGSVGPEALRLDGPVGMRSDNVRLEMELMASPPAALQRDAKPLSCRTEAE
jgi:hypothetical protein